MAAIPLKNMVLWSGGDHAPFDWDGGPVIHPTRGLRFIGPNHPLWQQSLHYTRAPTLLTAETIVAANIFLTHMADHFRLRTARKICGIRFHTMSRLEAMGWALAVFGGAIHMTPFGDSSEAWDQAHAAELVDEELSCAGER